MPPVVVIACEVLKSILDRVVDGIPVRFLPQGLHDVPTKLRASVQEQIDAIEEPSVILLGYGLCGNGLDGIKAGKHTLIVPRTDDCISLILGSYERYMGEFNSEPATFWYSKGWLETTKDFLVRHKENEEKYGKEMADWIKSQSIGNYHRVVLVGADSQELEEHRARVQDIAAFVGCRYEEMLGDTDYLAALIKKFRSLGVADEDFLIVPPGGETAQMQFWR